jgi:hypothetical protein
MNMQDFYRRLSVKPRRSNQRRLTDLTRVSRAQILNATREDTWFILVDDMLDADPRGEYHRIGTFKAHLFIGPWACLFVIGRDHHPGQSVAENCRY